MENYIERGYLLIFRIIKIKRYINQTFSRSKLINVLRNSCSSISPSNNRKRRGKEVAGKIFHSSPLIFAFSSLFLLFNCGGGKPPDWTKCSNLNTDSNNQQVKSNGTTENRIKTSDHLVVYLDVSGSMPGYISPYRNIPYGSLEDGKTVFSQTLLELRDTVTSLDSRVILRKMSKEISPPSLNEVELAQAAVNRNLFNAVETNIAAAIDSFDDPLLQKDSIPRFHILITDGVQSVKDSQGGNSQDLQNPCASRSDYHCVRSRIKSLLNNGWKGTVLGVKSEFKGKIPSELQPPLGIEYDSANNPERFRPFYLYIFSPDGEGLSRFVNALKKKLNDLSIKAKLSGGVREYPLAMNLTDGDFNSEVNIPKEFRSSLRIEKEQNGNISRFTVDNNLPKRKKASFTITLNVPWSEHAKNMGNWQELKPLLKAHLEKLDCLPESANECRSELKEKNFSINDAGQLVTEFEAEWQNIPGTEMWRMYRWTVNFDPSQGLPPWMSEWSTNNDLDDVNGNRTLNLTSTMSGLWNNKTMENQLIAEIQFRIGNE
jgi:hypothetical protein